jgi:hypothetical protein
MCWAHKDRFENWPAFMVDGRIATSTQWVPRNFLTLAGACAVQACLREVDDNYHRQHDQPRSTSVGEFQRLRHNLLKFSTLHSV